MLIYFEASDILLSIRSLTTPASIPMPAYSMAMSVPMVSRYLACWSSQILTRRIDWVLNQGTIFNTNSSGGELALILTQNNGGTRISSTRYVHYGKITATRASLSFALTLFEPHAPLFIYQ